MKMASFYKVSREKFQGRGFLDPAVVDDIYSSIKLPRRSTTGSAGYDFFLPYDVELQPGESIVVETGIRCEMYVGWVLMLYPRSGLGFKYKLRLANTTGVIDSDYFYSDNEGHIMAKLCNEGDKPIHLQAGTAFMQGVFLQYGTTLEDDADGVRNGGFGSTDRGR